MTDGKDYGDRVSGLHYMDFLAGLHRRLKPRTYLEIGVETGRTLAMAECASIGVDPAFRFGGNVVGKKPICLMFQETSDDFFARRKPAALLGGAVELAFLDGMHLFEFLLRDFTNVERHCSPSGIILMHDCLPPHISMTSRNEADRWKTPPRYRGSWTGDVWKLIPVLRQYRPDLSLDLVDCAPTGMVMVTGLDPTSKVLPDAYERIVAAHAAQPAKDDAERFDKYWASLDVLTTDTALAVASYSRAAL